MLTTSRQASKSPLNQDASDNAAAKPGVSLEKTANGRPRFQGCSNIKAYEILSKLGEGTFGVVYKARSLKHGTIMALKKVLMHNEKEGFPITSLREIKLLKMLSHPNILKLEEMATEHPKGAGKKKAIMYMVTPYMDHDLSGLLENPNVHITEPQIKCYMLQLLEGLKYLHGRQILHRDMKAANLLINNHGLLQIADFGLARPYEDPPPQPGKGSGEATRDYTVLVVTRWYRPPELLLQLKRYTPAIDMWGVGCVFGEMFTGRPILAGTSDINQTQLIFDLVGAPTEDNMPGWSTLPGFDGVKSFQPRASTIAQRFREQGSAAISLLTDLLRLDWRKRINAIDALEHPYFKSPPLPAKPGEIPQFEESHELDRRKFRSQQAALPPAPAGGTVGIGPNNDWVNSNNQANGHPPRRPPGPPSHQPPRSNGYDNRAPPQQMHMRGSGPPPPLPNQRPPAWQREPVQRDLALPPRPPPTNSDQDMDRREEGHQVMAQVSLIHTSRATVMGAILAETGMVAHQDLIEMIGEGMESEGHTIQGEEGVAAQLIIPRKIEFGTGTGTFIDDSRGHFDWVMIAMNPYTWTMGLESLTNGLHDTGVVQEPAFLRNIPSKNWIVQKFGGTSVGRFAENIAGDIVRPSLNQHRVAVVCSALSSQTKSEGTTNRLLRAAREAEHFQSRQYEAIVHSIRDEHVAAARKCIKSEKIRANLSAEIDEECRDLIVFLAAAQKVGEISTRSIDNIVSKGENLSCRYIAALLQDRGVDAQFVELSDIIHSKSQQALDQDFYENLGLALRRKIEACGDKIPVVTGYFGHVPGGLLEQIGRGYTDLCAALIAVGLGAEELQVWKEVDGIFTADPRKVPTARLLPTISPAEAAELTFYGSEVIHPFTMEQVIRARIPIRIKNVMNPRGPGTVIAPDPISTTNSAVPGYDAKIFRVRSSSLLLANQPPKRPTAVTIKHKILVLNVHSNKRSLSHGFFAKIFSTLDKWRLSVDLISTSEVHVSMALHSEAPLVTGGGEDEKKIVDQDLRGAVEELRRYGTVDIIDGMAILSLVGKQMKNMVGIAGKMFSTLGEHNVNIEMISQGASEINISCVIEERDADRAINILHTNLFTFLD
ncbi:Aspartokinase [Trapelia coarctata]|nr:Aspartokinase [Trapelia coarctata]